MKRYFFDIRLSGLGKTPEAAWNDATEQFALDPGPYEPELLSEPKDGEDEDLDE